MKGEEPKAESDKHVDAEGEQQKRAIQGWRYAVRSAGHQVHDRYWPNIIITILGVLILTPLAGVLMSSPRTIIIGIAAGLTLIIWLTAYQIDWHLRTPPPKLAEAANPASAVPASKDDVDEIKRQLTELHNHIKPPAEEITTEYPGVSLHAELRLHTLQENRRQYLFDLGQTDKERFSVYLDPDNVLTVALVSSKNEPYNIRVSPSDVPMERFIFLSAEVAIRDASTLLTAWINGTIVGKLELPFKVAPDRIEPTGAVIGADLNGQNGARLDLEESLLSPTTLTSGELKGLLENMRNKDCKQYVEFSGSQWMRNRGKGKGFYQDIPEAAPRLRKI